MINRPGLYDAFNIVALVVSCLASFAYLIAQRETFPLAWSRIGYEKTERLRQKNAVLGALFSKTAWHVLSAALLTGAFLLTDLVGDVFPFLANNEYFTENNYFALLFATPLFLPLVYLLLGADVRKSMDRLVPFMALELGVGKFACFCTGCCYGIPWEGGLFNYPQNEYQFPVQLLEAVVGLLLAAILFYLLLRNRTDGRGYPLFIVLYSGTRFLTEFLRGDHGADWGVFRPYQVLCLIGLFVGGLWLGVIAVLKAYGKRPMYGQNLVDLILEKRSKKA